MTCACLCRCTSADIERDEMCFPCAERTTDAGRCLGGPVEETIFAALESHGGELWRVYLANLLGVDVCDTTLHHALERLYAQGLVSLPLSLLQIDVQIGDRIDITDRNPSGRVGRGVRVTSL